MIKRKIFFIFLLIIIFFSGVFFGKNFFNKQYFFKSSFQNKTQNNFNQNFKNNLNINQEFDFKNKEPEINSVYKASVRRVIDGDTIELQDGSRVRYIGINSPESGEPFFSEAKKENENLVLNKEVKLQFDVQTKDKYGRFLAYVWVDNILVNKKLVLEGLAISETIQPNVLYQDEILASQKEAQANCKGIWQSICFPKKELSCVKISKIFADAAGDDNKNKNGEWIELKNDCPTDMNLNNWFLKDSSANNKYIFKNFVLKSGSLVKIYSGCGIDTFSELFWQCPEGKYAIWNNSGDHAFLYDNFGNLVNEYEY
ncbi:MAG: thermonuclease family protein [Minisyncoccia bacterium]